MITLKQSINGLISVIIFKRTMTNISFNITFLQDNYLGTYVSMDDFMTDTQMIAVLTYLITLCFLLRASDWSSNIQRRKCRTLPFTRNFPVTSAPWVWCWIDSKPHKHNFWSVKLSFFSYSSVLTYVLGAQTNRLIEPVILSTHNICFWLRWNICFITHS